MPRGLDHIVHAVHDLDAAAAMQAAFAQAGIAVTTIGGAVVIGASAAMGAVLVFEAGRT